MNLVKKFIRVKILICIFSTVIFLPIQAIGEPGELNLNKALIMEAKAGNSEMVEYLLNQGADPNAIAESGPNAGRSALYLSAREGHIECVTILLSAGADMNFEDPYMGETPLGVAIRKGKAEVIQILKKAGAKE